MVVKNCKNGDTKIISTIQPIKLASGSYRIIGIPKLAISLPGSKRRRMVGAQMTTIQNRVTAEVSKAYRSTFRKTRGTKLVRRVTYLTINHPTKKPKRIGKMGTPIPMLMKTVSRTIKIRKTHTGFELHSHFIDTLFSSRYDKHLELWEYLAISPVA
jgi:hypothetical protein